MLLQSCGVSFFQFLLDLVTYFKNSSICSLCSLLPCGAGEILRLRSVFSHLRRGRCIASGSVWERSPEFSDPVSREELLSRSRYCSAPGPPRRKIHSKWEKSFVSCIV